ncbi:MAG TPA: pyridoxal phosphate-dependent aminotransferase [Bacteroidetes bacterium]|nr:pyridoxal phosphate-dependent aminotransferase [Bacteroidota bacterium]
MPNEQKQKIWLSPPHMSGKESDFIQEAFDTNWIAPLGPHVNHFEQELATYCGTKGAVVLSSGTAAIHLALITLDVQPCDLVICQSFTFSATANPIKYLGAEPVFVDSESKTWNMCPDSLELAIKTLPKKPKAIIPVHLYGMPADMTRINKIAAHYEIPVLEDAAEALGSTHNGFRCGSLGKFGVLSFNGNKIITTSGGGALLSDDLDALQHVRFLATQARDKAPHYQHSHVGYNYRMSNVLAGLGRAQLEILPERIKSRRQNYEYYLETLGTQSGISFMTEPDGYFSNRWLTTILIDPEKTGGITTNHIRETLEADNIESRPLWKPMHVQPIFEGTKFFGNQVSESLFEQGLCLPSGSSLTSDELSRITDIIIDTLNKN